MKTGSLLAGCLPALLLFACGGDAKPAAGSAAPAQTAKSAPAVASVAAPKKQDPKADKPQKRRVRRPRINTQLVKTLFGNDPASTAAAVESTPALVALGFFDRIVNRQRAFLADNRPDRAPRRRYVYVRVGREQAIKNRHMPIHAELGPDVSGVVRPEGRREGITDGRIPVGGEVTLLDRLPQRRFEHP